MTPTLDGYAEAAFEEVTGAEVAALAADLAAVAATVATNPDLHAALTDTAVPGPSRRAVLAELLAGRVGAPALRVLSFAAGSVPAPEVPSAIDRLAIRAAHLVDGDTPAEAPLGHAAARRRVGGYATAIFEEVSTEDLEEVEDELFRFARTVENTPALRSALTDRELPLAVRQGVVHQLLADKVRPATLRLVDYVLAGGRPRDTVGTLDWLVEQTAAARGWRVARVRAAQDIETDQRDRLSGALATLTGSPVELQVTIDAGLLAGAKVEIGDLLVDATARGRLDRLAEHLLPGGWEDQGFGRTRGTDPEGAQ